MGKSPNKPCSSLGRTFALTTLENDRLNLADPIENIDSLGGIPHVDVIGVARAASAGPVDPQTALGLKLAGATAHCALGQIQCGGDEILAVPATLSGVECGAGEPVMDAFFGVLGVHR